MNITAKVQYIQITTKFELEPFATNTPEETASSIANLKTKLVNDEYNTTFAGISLFDVKNVLPLKNDKGEQELWLAVQADLTEVYKSKDLKIYDLDITYRA